MNNWFTQLGNKTRRYFSLRRSIQLELLEAVFWLALARGAVLSMRFKRLSPWLGPLGAETPTDDPAHQTEIRRVGSAIDAVSGYTPWHSNCLAQALAAKIMLRRRGIPSTLYLGLRKDQTSLDAHAWLRAGATIVTGGDIRPYTTIACFGATRSATLITPSAVSSSEGA